MMSLLLLSSTIDAASRGLEVVIERLREESTNDERIEAYIVNYYETTSVYATSLDLIKGDYVSGTLDSIKEVDGDYYVIKSPPSGAGETWIELIENGDFETGSLSPWLVDEFSPLVDVTYGVTTTEYGYSAYCRAKKTITPPPSIAIVTFYQDFTVEGTVLEGSLQFMYRINFNVTGSKVRVLVYIDNIQVYQSSLYTSSTDWITVPSIGVTNQVKEGTHTLSIRFVFSSSLGEEMDILVYLDNVSLKVKKPITGIGLFEVVIEVNFEAIESFGLIFNSSGLFSGESPIEAQLVKGSEIVSDYLFTGAGFSITYNFSELPETILMRFLSTSEFTVYIDLFRLEAKVPSDSFNVTIKSLSSYVHVLRVWYVKPDLHTYINVDMAVGYGDTITVIVPNTYEEGVQVYVVTSSGRKYLAKLKG